MGVEVRSDGDLGVAQSLGDHLQIDPGVQRQAGIGVAQVVEPDNGQPRVLGQRLEVPGGVLGSQRTAVLAGEHQPGLVPRGPPRCALEVLRLLLSAEHQDGFGVEVENAIPAFGLGCADHAAPIDVGDLLVDGQGRAVEVEVLPAQADASPRRMPVIRIRW